MTIPSIPTDSLYKFGFVGGLLLILAAFYLYMVKMDSYIELSNNIDIEQAVLGERSKALKQKMDFFDGLMKNEPYSESLNFLVDSNLQVIDAERVDLNRYETIIETKVQHFAISSEKLRLVIRVCWGMMVFGLVIAFISGLLWYIKLQKFQDMMTVLQYEKLKNSNQ